MHEGQFAGSPEMLRSPGRVEFLEAKRVIDLCLEAFTARSVLDLGTGAGCSPKALPHEG